VFFVCVNNLGLSYPVPWDDESAFLLQAIAFSENGTLFSENLNSNREILWMPPGYMIIVGLLYYFFGISLSIARDFSLFLYISIYLIIVISIIKHYKYSYFVYIIILMYLMNPSSIIISNIARMDVLIAFCSVLIFHNLLRNNIIIAIAIALISITIHFNGIYFLIPIVIIFFYNSFYYEKCTTNIINYVIFILCIGLFLLYLLYVFKNFEYFLNDMNYQFSRKLGRDNPFTSIYNLIYMGLILILMIISVSIKRKISVVAIAFSLAYLLLWIVGGEMWYSFFGNMFKLFLFFGVTMLLPRSLYIFICLFMISLSIKSTFNTNFAGMVYSPFKKNSEYIDSKSINLIENQIFKIREINSIPSDKRLSISFGIGRYDILFYKFSIKNNFLIKHQLPLQISDNNRVDICIYLTRPEDPIWLKNFDSLPSRENCKYGIITSEKNGHINFIEP
jgi:hypothetical protein